MALDGRLEDLALLDLLQIVAFARKSGNLRVVDDEGKGGVVVFDEGRILAACSSSTLEPLRRAERAGLRPDAAALMEQIRVALRELTSVRSGRFRFEMDEPPDRAVTGLPLETFLLPRGVSTQQILLDVARELDEERRDTSRVFEGLLEDDEDDEAAPPATTLVLVDDERPVREIVAEELAANGYRVRTADGPASGLVAVRQAARADGPLVVVVDLRMPPDKGRHFLGGLELVRRLRRSPVAPVEIVAMLEAPSARLEAKARRAGVDRFVYKPNLSKLDAAQYEADLRTFGRRLAAELAAPRTPPSPPLAPAEPEPERRLRSMVEQLARARAPGDIARIVLKAGSLFLRRGVLLLAGRGRLSAAGGFGLVDAATGAAVPAVRRLRIEVEPRGAFEEVLATARPVRLRPAAGWPEPLRAVLPVETVAEAVLLPLLHSGRVLAVLYGDNGPDGAPIDELAPLELFLGQAGLALDNVFLQRKLQSYAERILSGGSAGLDAKPSTARASGGSGR